MKKNILLLSMCLLTIMGADVQAQEWCDKPYCYEEGCCWADKNFYVKIFGGANFLQNVSRNRCKYDTGYVLAGSLGYNWQCGLRLEGEYAFRRNTIKEIHFCNQGSSNDGHFQTSSYMANLLWDLPLTRWSCCFACWDLQPFIGAGIGYDSQQMHASNSRIIFNQKWHRFSWQVMAGFAYPIFCNTALTFEYKFHQGKCHFYNHSVGVGLVYEFGL